MRFSSLFFWCCFFGFLSCGEESSGSGDVKDIVCPFIDYVEIDRTTITLGESVDLTCHVVDADASTSVRWEWEIIGGHGETSTNGFSTTEGTHTTFTPSKDTIDYRIHCIVSKEECDEWQETESVRGYRAADVKSVELEVEEPVSEVTINAFDSATHDPLRAAVIFDDDIRRLEEGGLSSVEWTEEDGTYTQEFETGFDHDVLAFSNCYKVPPDYTSASFTTEIGEVSVDVPLDRLDVSLEWMETDVPFALRQDIVYKVKVSGIDDVAVMMGVIFTFDDFESEDYFYMSDDGEDDDEVEGDGIWTKRLISNGSAWPDLAVSVIPVDGYTWGISWTKPYKFRFGASDTETFYDLSDDWAEYTAKYCGDLPH